MSAAAVIVAAGSGNRFGSEIPKQFLRLGPMPVWQWSYHTFDKHPQIREIVVVVAPADAHRLLSDVPTVAGGKSRTESVQNGLNALSCPPSTPVLIHDAARPGLTGAMIDDLLEALHSADGAAPALPVSDALKRVSDTLKTVDRDQLVRVQTPQVFRLADIKSALDSTEEALVDDLEALQRAGKNILLVPGSKRLEKITRPGDLEWMETMLMGGETRVGTGFDVHAFEPGEFTTLCGVQIPHDAKLKGHSDADAAWHALTDAILGALALGDIGDHFPPSDDKWKGALSKVFLKHAAQLAADKGYGVRGVDITLICERPKIKPHREAMRQSTADCLGIDIGRVSVKATTTEGLGFTGRSEGIAAQATVTLKQVTPIEE